MITPKLDILYKQFGPKGEKLAIVADPEDKRLMGLVKVIQVIADRVFIELLGPKRDYVIDSYEQAVRGVC